MLTRYVIRIIIEKQCNRYLPYWFNRLVEFKNRLNLVGLVMKAYLENLRADSALDISFIVLPITHRKQSFGNDL